MPKKNKYRLISLLKYQKKFYSAPTCEQEKRIKNFYIIYNQSTQQYVKDQSYRLIMLNIKQNKLGLRDFQIKTNLTLNSPSDKIHEEIERFFKAIYKQNSINIYPTLREVRL